jgi:hypothetical protein
MFRFVLERIDRLRKSLKANGGEEFVYFCGISIASYAAINNMFLGYSVYLASGFFGAIIVSVMSCVILYATSLTLLRVSIPNQLTSLDLVYYYFGRRGAGLCAIALTLMFLGWFLWQLSFLVHFVKHFAIIRIPFFSLISDEKIGVSVGLFCCAMACTERIGLRIISIVFVPLLLFLLFCLFFFLPFSFDQPITKIGTIDFSALSILCCSLVTLIMFSPTFFKSATSIDVVRRSIKFTYLLLLPLFYLAGIIFGIFAPSHNILSLALVSSGIGPFLLFLYVLVCVVNICSTDLLYGADVVLQMTSSKSKMPAIFLLSSVGISFFGVVNLKFNADVHYIEFLGSLVVGILSVILTKMVVNDYHIASETTEQQHGNYFALLVAYCVGLFVWSDIFKITGVPFFDIALTSVAMTLYNIKHPQTLKFLSHMFSKMARLVSRRG